MKQKFFRRRYGDWLLILASLFLLWLTATASSRLSLASSSFMASFLNVLAPNSITSASSITVLDNGDVGIGISTPMAKLDINGRIKIRGGDPGAGKILTSTTSDGLAMWSRVEDVIPHKFRAVYDNVRVGISGNPAMDIEFSSDGRNLFILSHFAVPTYPMVLRYTLSTPWDISSMTYHSNFIVRDFGYPTSVTFRPDGLRMFVAAGLERRVFQYNLANPWDVTSVMSGALGYGSDSQGCCTVRDVVFNNDGTKIYFMSAVSSLLNQYSLSSPWDVTRISSYDATLSLGGTTFMDDISFNSEGSRMYILDQTGDDHLLRYSLSANSWDILSAIRLSGDFYFNRNPDVAHSVEFSSDGTKMFVLGHDTVWQYSLSSRP